ncbi:unnamed protein product [Dicrocoelium dendriticum]|nr:unnamed protein product [Dicrocoelium dendriticum]
MHLRSQLLFCIVYTVLLSHAKPHKESRDEKEHFPDDPERHDVNFDHNAFLGEETAKEYAKLTREQSREKLKEIVKKIDTNHDGKVTEKELKDWITDVGEQSRKQVTDKRWVGVNPRGLDPLPWKEYTEGSFGSEEERLKDVAGAEQYKQLVRREKRRWDAADQNKDGALSKNEFMDFLHPEDRVHMKDAIIEELLETVDMDKDGKVSEKEYLDDLARSYQTPLVPGQPDPDWVAREREQYQKYRDLDHNGYMDKAEVGEWIMPADYDAVDAETQHLFYHADSDKDNVLTEQEILDQQDLFVSSQATNYGTVLEQHQEL